MPVATQLEALAVRSKSPPAQAEKQAKRPRRDAAQMQTYVFYHSLLDYHEPYLNDRAETLLGITIVPLDLRSDSVLDGGPRFIEPVSADKMKAFVEANKTWDEPILLPIQEDDEDHPKKLEGKPRANTTKYYNGSYMLHGLEQFAQTPDDELDPHGPVSFSPDWELAMFGWSKMQENDSKDMYLWSLQFMYEAAAADRPHTHAFINHAVPLENNKLTTGEIATATGIISSQRCFRGFNHHRFIPATIFSASSRDFRVVQVWHDRENPDALHVRRSPIMDFMQGAKANKDDWIALLCWFMGKQLENTVPGSGSKSGRSESGEVAKPEREGDERCEDHSDTTRLGGKDCSSGNSSFDSPLTSSAGSSPANNSPATP